MQTLSQLVRQAGYEKETVQYFDLAQNKVHPPCARACALALAFCAGGGPRSLRLTTAPHMCVCLRQVRCVYTVLVPKAYDGGRGVIAAVYKEAKEYKSGKCASKAEAQNEAVRLALQVRTLPRTAPRRATPRCRLVSRRVAYGSGTWCLSMLDSVPRHSRVCRFIRMRCDRSGGSGMWQRIGDSNTCLNATGAARWHWQNEGHNYIGHNYMGYNHIQGALAE